MSCSHSVSYYLNDYGILNGDSSSSTTQLENMSKDFFCHHNLPPEYPNCQPKLRWLPPWRSSLLPVILEMKDLHVSVQGLYHDYIMYISINNQRIIQCFHMTSYLLLTDQSQKYDSDKMAASMRMFPIITHIESKGFTCLTTGIRSCPSISNHARLSPGFPTVTEPSTTRVWHKQNGCLCEELPFYRSQEAKSSDAYIGWIRSRPSISNHD